MRGTALNVTSRTASLARSRPGRVRGCPSRRRPDGAADAGQHLPAPRLLLDHQDRPRAADSARRRRRGAVLRGGGPGASCSWGSCRSTAGSRRRRRRMTLLVGATLFFLVCIELFAAAVTAARPVCGRRLLRLGRHLQHLAGGAVLVVRQRPLHQGERRAALPAHRDRHDGRRAARLARRGRLFESGLAPELILQISAVLLAMSGGLYLAVNAAPGAARRRPQERRCRGGAASRWCWPTRICGSSPRSSSCSTSSTPPASTWSRVCSRPKCRSWRRSTRSSTSRPTSAPSPATTSSGSA